MTRVSVVALRDECGDVYEAGEIVDVCTRTTGYDTIARDLSLRAARGVLGAFTHFAAGPATCEDVGAAIGRRVIAIYATAGRRYAILRPEAPR